MSVKKQNNPIPGREHYPSDSDNPHFSCEQFKQAGREPDDEVDEVSALGAMAFIFFAIVVIAIGVITLARVVLP